LNFRHTLVASLFSSVSFFAANLYAAEPPPLSLPPQQDAAAAPGPQTAPALGLKNRPLWELGAGVGVLYLPDYRGSDQSNAYLLPTPYFVYRGKWLKADREGTRALLVDTDRVKLDVSVGASPPTRTRDSNARANMRALPGTFELGPDLNITLAEASTKRWKLDLRFPVRAAITLERDPRFIGTTFSPNLNLDLNEVGGGWQLGLLTGPLFADAKNHGFFYNVEPADANASRPSYRAAGGYSGWRVLAATSRRSGDTWWGAFVRYDQLGGAAFEDSPLVRRRSAVTAGLAVSWVFATSSQRVNSAD
jgi:MipA family protein